MGDNLLAVKQVLLIRSDLNMRKGKMIAQGAHVSLLSFREAQEYRPVWVPDWERTGYTKIALQVSSEEELFALRESARQLVLPHALVQDLGHTEFHGEKT